jgi:nucleoside-diphosphate-sugar epimerase
MTGIQPLSAQRILVTGASGFVGIGLLPELMKKGYLVRAAVRRNLGVCEEIHVGDIGRDTIWDEALDEVDIVIHLAGRAHVLNESLKDPLPLYREVNTEGTRRLADAAAAARVRRFIFVSSIKVNGESTADQPYTADDDPAPEDAYGISKWEAEKALWEVAGQSGMEVCVIRPPLIYGPGVKGNLRRLIRLVKSGLPIPLGAVQNLRSLVSVYNLHDLIIRCVEHPAASGRTFLISDGEDLSISDLLRKLSREMDCSLRLLPVPPTLLKLALTLLGRKRDFERLCGSLQVDITAAKTILDWQPPVHVDDGVRRMLTN